MELDLKPTPQLSLCPSRILGGFERVSEEPEGTEFAKCSCTLAYIHLRIFTQGKATTSVVTVVFDFTTDACCYVTSSGAIISPDAIPPVSNDV